VYAAPVDNEEALHLIVDACQTVRNYCHYLNCVKMAAFQFYLQSGKQMVADRHVVFCQKFPCEKRMCETVRCRDATASSFVAKVRGEVFAHFHAFAVKLHSSMRNGLFGIL
jgi:hypothetical protein